MNAARHVGRLGQTAFAGRLGQPALLRPFSTNHVVQADIDPHSTASYKKLKRLQELYQREDGVEEVYLKGGVKSKILYQGILGGTIVAFIWCGVIVAELISK